jgi:MFS family permease
MSGYIKRLWRRYDRRLWTLVFVQMIVACGFGAAMPFVSLYLYRELGVSMRGVGTIMLVAALVTSVGRIIGGELSDRLGRKPLIVLAMAARTGIFLLMAYVIHLRASYLLVAGVFLAIRFFGAVIQPAVRAMVTDVADPSRRVESFGLLRIGMNAGWAAGPALGGFLLAISYSSLFLVTAGASLIGFLIMLCFTTESIRARAQERFELRKVLSAVRNRPFFFFCLSSLGLFLVMGQFASTLSVFSTEIIKISEVELGFLYTLNGIICVLFQWPAAFVAARMGTFRALIGGCLLYALGYLSVGFVPAFGYLLGSMVVITLGEILHSPSASTAVAAMAPEGKIGRYMGFFGLAEALGWSVGPFIGGLLFDATAMTAPTLLWGAIAGLGVLAAFGYGFTSRRFRPEQEVS